MSRLRWNDVQRTMQLCADFLVKTWAGGWMGGWGDGWVGRKKTAWLISPPSSQAKVPSGTFFSALSALRSSRRTVDKWAAGLK